MNTEHLDRLILARSENLRMKAALILARQRATDTEIARQNAEQSHANLVADALLSGERTPSKPAALSAIQSADDSADAALAIIETRVQSAEGEQSLAAFAAADFAINELAKSQHDEAREALKNLIGPFQKLISAIGRNGANYAVNQLFSRPFPDSSASRLNAIQDLCPEVSALRTHWEIRCGEAHVIPSPDEITALCSEAQNAH